MAMLRIKDRDIANRGTGRPAAGADEILEILTEDGEAAPGERQGVYEQGGRPELAAAGASRDRHHRELPAGADGRGGRPERQSTRSIAEIGAIGPGDMGKVMAALKQRYRRADGFRQGGRAGQGAAQLARPTPQLPPLCIAGTPAAVARFCPKDWLDRMAMRFPPAFLDEIRGRVPISAGGRPARHLGPQKTNAARGDYWACCPFHGEKTPSFHCEDKKGRYHCFGCGVSGDHFRFLTELDGSSFPEAVERVADMAGVPLPARDPGAERRERERASLTDVMEMAAAFFEARLQAPDGAAARAYLREPRADPGHPAALSPRLCARQPQCAEGASRRQGRRQKAQIEACGLTVFGDDVPVSYDRFRDRVMFPIPDSRGAIIAFGGRALSPTRRPNT